MLKSTRQVFFATSGGNTTDLFLPHSVLPCREQQEQRKQVSGLSRAAVNLSLTMKPTILPAKMVIKNVHEMSQAIRAKGKGENYREGCVLYPRQSQMGLWSKKTSNTSEKCDLACLLMEIFPLVKGYEYSCVITQ